MLSDVRNKLNRRRKRKDDKKGVQGGIDNLPGLGNVSRLSSPFSEHGIDFDLNDVAEIADKVYLTSKKLKEHWTFLNVMRHLLLVPNDEVNGRKMWALIEMFCNQVFYLFLFSFSFPFLFFFFLFFSFLFFSFLFPSHLPFLSLPFPPGRLSRPHRNYQNDLSRIFALVPNKGFRYQNQKIGYVGGG